MTLDLATDTVEKLMKQKRLKLPKGAFIHSDQGSYYTSPTFQKLLKKYKLGQSMSRRGNCWDNAPQESFFGHNKKAERFFKEVSDFVDKLLGVVAIEPGL